MLDSHFSVLLDLDLSPEVTLTLPRFMSSFLGRQSSTSFLDIVKGIFCFP